MTHLDVARSASNIVFAALQPLAGAVPAVTKTGKSIAQRSRKHQGPTTPANGAFSVWGPLFALSLDYALRSARQQRREDVTLRRVGWLSAAVFAGDTAWSLNAEYRDIDWVSVGLIGASTASAVGALLLASNVNSPEAALARRALAPLAGWLTVASFANLEQTLNLTQGKPLDQTGRSQLLIAGATVCAGSVAVLARGSLWYASTVAWGLSAIVLRNVRERNAGVAAAAGIGLGVLGLATLIGRRRPSQA